MQTKPPTRPPVPQPPMYTLLRVEADGPGPAADMRLAAVEHTVAIFTETLSGLRRTIRRCACVGLLAVCLLAPPAAVFYAAAAERPFV